MERTRELAIGLLLSIWLIFPSFSASLPTGETMSSDDIEALRICEGVIELFKQCPDSIWPGYNLAERPYLLYMPDKWVLLFNCENRVDGFTEYPQNWPDLRANVQYLQGKYDDLAGQLSFDIPVDTLQVAAVPLGHQNTLQQFAFVVHECFHQYQYDNNWDIPWEREEKYPIQDVDNTALAYLEMQSLMDALKMAEFDNQQACRGFARQFVAVRNQRWKRLDPAVRTYERGKEILEGTAKYVELKGIALAKQLRYESSLRDLTGPLQADLPALSMPQLILEFFKDRITGNSVSPEDMPRYRIYPVGAAQGYLLDYFTVDWKSVIPQAGAEFTFVELLQDKLEIDSSQVQDLVRKAKNNYDYENIVGTTKKLIKEYQSGFEKELATFEAQPGYRIEIELNPSGTRRSRSSGAKKWLVDNGTRELRNHYYIYSVKSNDLLLQVHDIGILEQNDWAASKRKIAFFVPKITSISLNGKLATLTDELPHRFESIDIDAENLTFSYSKPGSIIITDRSIKIDISR